MCPPLPCGALWMVIRRVRMRNTNYKTASLFTPSRGDFVVQPSNQAKDDLKQTVVMALAHGRSEHKVAFCSRWCTNSLGFGGRDLPLESGPLAPPPFPPPLPHRAPLVLAEKAGACLCLFRFFTTQFSTRQWAFPRRILLIGKQPHNRCAEQRDLEARRRTTTASIGLALEQSGTV